MMKPITSAMAAALALCAGSSPAHAKADRPVPAPRQASHIAETPAGFVIQARAPQPGETPVRQVAAIRLGSNVHIDGRIVAPAPNEKESGDASQ